MLRSFSAHAANMVLVSGETGSCKSTDLLHEIMFLKKKESRALSSRWSLDACPRGGFTSMGFLVERTMDYTSVGKSRSCPRLFRG